jgi:hypothetical protein
MRTFGLIRHKRNQWIQPEDSFANARQQGDGSASPKPSQSSDVLVQQSEDDSTLRNADTTIGTALLLVNSQRAMLLL